MIDSRAPSASAGGDSSAPTPSDSLTAAAVEAAAGAESLTPGPVVLLVDAAARTPGWGAEAAIALAGEWARAGRRIVLADLHLEQPVLHERLGETNRDGVVDIFLYGASLARSARPVAGRGFYLIPAGTYAADAEAVLGHARWPKLLAGFRDANASLLLFAPADPQTLELLAQWSVEAVLLTDAQDGADDDALMIPSDLRIAATLSAPRAMPDESEPEAAPDVPEPEVEPGMLPDAAVPAARSDAEVEAVPPVDAPLAEAEESSALLADSSITPQPAPVAPRGNAREEPAAAPRRRSSAALWIVVLVVLLAAAAALLLYFRPDLLPIGDGARTVPGPPADAAAPSAVPAAPPVPAGTALPYAVQVRAYRSPGAAREQALAEERRLGDEPVYVSPELIQGILYYRVLAGLPADSATALRLRQRLLDAGAIEAEDAAGGLDLIRYAPLAFRLGEFASRREALERAEALEALGIPSYPAVLPYSDGSERWLLYGGAFRDTADAEGMRELLATAGLEAPLVERQGRPSDRTP